MVLIHDPDEAARIASETIRHSFGLTKAEAQIACSVASGISIQEYAAVHRLTIGTVRQRIKQVLAKTETHSQPQLVALVRDHEAALNGFGNT